MWRGRCGDRRRPRRCSSMPTCSRSTRSSSSRCSARCSTDPTIQFVKAAYDRPPTDPAVPSNGGGRVTELMARPLISAFWPELSGVLQPLAGEYAARREPAAPAAVPLRVRRRHRPAARRVRRRSGLAGIAQVDLRRRWHRHSDLPVARPDGGRGHAHRTRSAGRGRPAARRAGPRRRAVAAGSHRGRRRTSRH